MEKLRSSPSEHFLVINKGVSKMKKRPKEGKTRFLEEFWTYLQNGKVIDFAKIKTSQKPRIFFHEIQNLSSQRPIFLGPQSSASSSNFFGQGTQISDYFGVFLTLL